MPAAVALWLALALACAARAQEGPAAGEGEAAEVQAPAPEAAAVQPPGEGIPVAVLPFRIHSSRPLGYLTESIADLLASRLAASGSVRVLDAARVAEVMGDLSPASLSDAELQSLAQQLEAGGVVTGSLTELAGHFSLDVRVTPAAAGRRSRTLVLTASSEEELLGRLDELSERVIASVATVEPSRVLSVELFGAGDLEGVLRERITTRPGDVYDPERVREDRERLEEHPQVANVSVDSERSAEGIHLRYRVVRAEMLFGGPGREEAGPAVAEIRVRGNRRIEADAIRARIRTSVGEPVRAAQLAADIREVFALGFFRNVFVEEEQSPEGLVLVFVVEENPVIRQITISGNENVDTEDIRDALTLTTGSTLDYPLLHENTDRIEALYRAEGYYLADVGFEIETLTEGSVAVHFEVDENEKLRLREITFTGNQAFDDDDLREDFATKRWRFWSYVTSWLDKSGTYSEPVFLRDLRTVEKKYTDAGYLQVEIGEPQVDATEEGLFVTVEVREGPQFRVGEIQVSGDDTVDLEALREKLQLEEGDIFNRSYLTEDVESLERHYTDRGFYFASVQPGTRVVQDERIVDVEFVVEKGPLYFIRHIDISGNTRTIDPVIRREMQVVEGQLYSARALQVSNTRVRGLGFFEDVSFEPKTTGDPSQLDLAVSVVERPTGSFSFGAGFSSRDKLVLNAALSQANLFGRGYGVSLSADIGGSTNRFYFSASDPYFLGTSFSMGTTLFLTQVDFDNFDLEERGVDFQLGHALREDNTARGFLRYGFSQRRIQQQNNVLAAGAIFRERLQGNESTSLVGLSMRSDTRDDRFAPTSGTTYGATLEYAGLGGFANFLRFEGRVAWYLGAPDWLLDRSTFVVSSRLGYALPFNAISDWEFPELENEPTGCTTPGSCINVARLDQIDTDLKLPLTERYFLGGLGPFQLRGFESRSVGPRRAILQRSGLFGTGALFFPVGRVLSPSTDPLTGEVVVEAVCNDVRGSGSQGDGDGNCNDINDKDIGDFEDLDETDVVGGASFVSNSLEYRFPISEEVGLQGVAFLDMGNAFAEGDNLFDVTQWRYGYGAGLLWFSPFGPLQVVLGFPIDPESFEDSPVFEFSVGGFGI